MTSVAARNARVLDHSLWKAKELLASLPENQRSFNLKAVSPEHWWMV